MAKYRHCLPHAAGPLFVTDGGLETTLIYHDDVELPFFAAFDLLKSAAGVARLRTYFTRYIEIARAHKLGIVLESPTWRASHDWGRKLGYDDPALAGANRSAIDLLLDLRAQFETAATAIVVSGNLGPRGDGYRPDSRMSAREAQSYHAAQIETFAHADADMVSALTMNYSAEAIGIAAAAKAAAMPVAISFTLETDGRLPSGESLEQALARADEATERYPEYYMINCAHPTHFEHVLRKGGAWLSRIRGLRCNASKRSHAQLDEATELDAGDPRELGAQYRSLHALIPQLAVVGGCCGTDHRHVEAICSALARSRV